MQKQQHQQTTLYADSNDNYIIPLNYANNNRFIKNSPANLRANYSSPVKQQRSPSLASYILANQPPTAEQQANKSSQSVRSRSNRSVVRTSQSRRLSESKKSMSSQSVAINHNESIRHAEDNVRSAMTTNNNNNNGDFRTSSRTVTSSVQQIPNDESSMSIRSPTKSIKHQESKSAMSKNSLLQQLNTNDLDDIKSMNDDDLLLEEEEAYNEPAQSDHDALFLSKNDFNPTMTTIANLNINDEPMFMANDLVDLKDDISLMEMQHELNLTPLEPQHRSSFDKYMMPTVAATVNSSNHNKVIASPVKSMQQAFRSPSLNDFYYCDPYGDDFMKHINEQLTEYRPHEDSNIKTPDFSSVNSRPPVLTTVEMATAHLNPASDGPRHQEVTTIERKRQEKPIEKSPTKYSLTSLTRRVFNRFAKHKPTGQAKVAPSPAAKSTSPIKSKFNQKSTNNNNNNNRNNSNNKSYSYRREENLSNRSLNNINRYSDSYSYRLSELTAKSYNHLPGSNINDAYYSNQTNYNTMTMSKRSLNNDKLNKSNINNCSTLQQPRMRFDKYRVKDVFLNSSTTEPLVPPPPPPLPPAPPLSKPKQTMVRPKPAQPPRPAKPFESQFIMPIKQPILIKDKVLTPDYMETATTKAKNPLAVNCDVRRYNRVERLADRLWFESLNDRQYEYFLMNLPELTEESSFVGQSKFDWLTAQTPEYTFYKLFKPNSPMKRIREN